MVVQTKRVEHHEFAKNVEESKATSLGVSESVGHENEADNSSMDEILIGSS